MPALANARIPLTISSLPTSSTAGSRFWASKNPPIDLFNESLNSVKFLTTTLKALPSKAAISLFEAPSKLSPLNPYTCTLKELSLPVPALANARIPSTIALPTSVLNPRILNPESLAGTVFPVLASDRGCPFSTYPVASTSVALWNTSHCTAFNFCSRLLIKFWESVARPASLFQFSVELAAV